MSGRVVEVLRNTLAVSIDDHSEDEPLQSSKQCSTQRVGRGVTSNSKISTTTTLRIGGQPRELSSLSEESQKHVQQ